MAKEEAPRAAKIYTLKVTLEGSDPPIWRRFQVSDEMILGGLHFVLQLGMGWSTSHLHEFVIGRTRYGEVDPEEVLEESPEDEDEFEFELWEVIKRKGTKFTYAYDFGDGWLHEIVLEEIRDPEPGVCYPICTGGERRCPPEDCGGIDGYYDLLEVLRDPKHENYEACRDWIPEGFDPDAFDAAETTQRLREMEALRELLEQTVFDEDGELRVPGHYEEPVSRLLTLGEPQDPLALGKPQDQLDYAEIGIGPEHIPGLIQMATDMALHWADQDSTEVWAPLHAWRALGQLRAESAIDPLAGLLRMIDEDDDDWIGEDLPTVFGEIGGAALPALSAYMQDDSHGLFARAAAGESLARIGQRCPEARDACVAALTAQLERFSDNEEELNGLVISDLLDLDAVESAPVMERAFAADAVDLTIPGDWEDVQVELGLLDKRITPPPEFEFFAPNGFEVRPSRQKAPPPPPAGKKREKTKKKRKNEKKSRKKNRKR